MNTIAINGVELTGQQTYLLQQAIKDAARNRKAANEAIARTDPLFTDAFGDDIEKLLALVIDPPASAP